MTDQKTPRRYVPETERLNREFFQACASGALHLQRCDGCETFRHPPRYYCPRCFSGDWSWQPISGIGQVASWVTTHLSIDRAWALEAPPSAAPSRARRSMTIGAWRARPAMGGRARRQPGPGSRRSSSHLQMLEHRVALAPGQLALVARSPGFGPHDPTGGTRA